MHVTQLKSPHTFYKLVFLLFIRYNEIKDYDYNNPGFSYATGHFTQVIWARTTKVGVGIARKGNFIYVVARYSPPGNYLSQFEANVKKLK